MPRRVLIANRGEIALRIARTAREMGIYTVGIYSAADKTSMHRRWMDESYPLAGTTPAETYLNMDVILNVAKKARCDAIHPGYGFLAENPSFVKRCDEEGFAFVGPGSRAMALSGDKIASRRKAREVGIPVTPGIDKPILDLDSARQIAERLGFPLIFKATAGGGGIGMSEVKSPAELDRGFQKAQATALNAFGNPNLFAEKYLRRVRHLEVQVLMGRKGEAVQLGERECSIQRRNQKLIEESPSEVVDERLRSKIGAMALKLMREVGYRNAGTVEFLFSEGKVYFNEINARLQVEHPVTEMVTGIDLVRSQLEICDTGMLPLSQGEVEIRGSSIECRINAEDPFNSFLPSPGQVTSYTEPSGPGVRIDSGIESGTEVPPYYDPLLAKLVVHASKREDAVLRMRRCIDEVQIGGISTNLPLHKVILGDEAFLKGDLSTDFLRRRRILQRLSRSKAGDLEAAAVAVALAVDTRNLQMFAERVVEGPSAASPWKRATWLSATEGEAFEISARNRWKRS